jgi:hypothetical protein
MVVELKKTQSKWLGPNWLVQNGILVKLNMGAKKPYGGVFGPKFLVKTCRISCNDGPLQLPNWRDMFPPSYDIGCGISFAKFTSNWWLEFYHLLNSFLYHKWMWDFCAPQAKNVINDICNQPLWRPLNISKEFYYCSLIKHFIYNFNLFKNEFINQCPLWNYNRYLKRCLDSFIGLCITWTLSYLPNLYNLFSRNFYKWSLLKKS